MARFSTLPVQLLAHALLVLCAGSGSRSAQAHEVSYVTIGASFETAERTFSIEMAMEIVPTDDAALNAQVSPEQAASTFASEVLSLYFGDQEFSVVPQIRIIEPETDEVDANNPERVRIVATLAGDIPGEADYFTLHLSEENEATAIMVQFVDGVAGRRAEVLYPGEFSNPIYLRPTVKGDPFDANVPQADTSGAGAAKSADDSSAQSESGPAEQNSATLAEDAGPSAVKSFAAGFRQVLPQGYVVLTALLVLFFFSTRGRDLVRQLAAFAIPLTGAFSVSALGFSPPEELSEWLPLAALLCIALLACENLFHSKLRWWRLVLLVLAGGLYGLWLAATADGLGYAGTPVGTILIHLLGIGAAMALVMLALHLAVASLRGRGWYRSYVAFPASLAALGLAVFWIVAG